jgi:hypothetical protein
LIDPDLADLIPGYLDKRRQDLAGYLDRIDIAYEQPD